MRLAFILPNYHPVTCGVADFSMRLASEITRRGHEVVMFTHAPAEAHPEAPHIPVVAVDEPTPLRLAEGVARAVGEGAFTHAVVHYSPRMWGASRFGSPAVPLVAAQLSRGGLSVVMVCHEPFTPWSLRPDLAVGAVTLRFQFAAIMGSSGRTFVTTTSRRQHLIDLMGPGAPEADVLRVGASALPPMTPRVPGRRRLGLFSTLAYGKRFDAVVEAFEILHARHPATELVLVGDLGSRAAGAGRALLERIEASPGRERIRVTGRVPLSEVARLIASLDVYLFPMDTGANTRSSTLPVALAAGVPVVATRGLETDAIFVDRENVLFAGDLDGHSLAAAAEQILDDDALAEHLGAGGRRLYEEHLSWEKITDSFLSRLPPS